MSEVAAAALVMAVAVSLLTLVLLRWRRRLAALAEGSADPEEPVDSADVDRRAVDVAFDGIVGHLLLTDPTFVDTGERLAGQDDSGAAG